MLQLSVHQQQQVRAALLLLLPAGRGAARRGEGDHYNDVMMMMIMVQVCNACVLIVKRWTQLPGRARGTRHWGHVVDARHGPGMKNVAGRRQTGDTRVTRARGQGETQQQEEESLKIRRKQSVIKKEVHRDTDSSSVPDFIDLTYWTR